MSTTNLGLDMIDSGAKIKLFPNIFNGDIETIDGAVGPGFSSSRSVASVSSAEEASMAYVSNNNTHVAIPAGRFVYVKNHGSLAEGLYESKSEIAANGVLSGSNLTAVSNGGLNALHEKLHEKFPELFEKNARSITTIAALATDISTYATGDIIIYSISPEVGTVLCGDTVSLNCACIVFKASSNNAYYTMFYRDTYASGNISLQNGAVTIKYASHRVKVSNVSSTLPDITIQSSTTTEVGGINLEDAGHYLIILTARWASNASGRRHIWFSESNAGSRLNIGSEVITAPVNGTYTVQQLTLTYRADAAKTVHFVAYQNSGSALVMNPRYSIARLR